MLVLIIREFKPYPNEFHEKGVALKTAVSRRWTLKAQDSQVKASQYVSGVMAFLDNCGGAAHEFIFLGEGGVVAEGTISNIFIVKEKRKAFLGKGGVILKFLTWQFVRFKGLTPRMNRKPQKRLRKSALLE